MVVAATKDPGVGMDVAGEVLLQLKADAQLELEALRQPLPADVAKLALDGKSASYSTIVPPTQQVAASKEAPIQS